MKRTIRLASLLTAFAIACGKAEDPASTAAAPSTAPAPDPAARQAEWSWLEATKRTIDEKRASLAASRAAVAPGAALPPEAVALQREIEALDRELGRRVVAYINADPPKAGQPMTPEQLAAVRLKSAEDLLIAKDHVDFAGDYEKAIGIYAAALRIDPENVEVKAALFDAETKRFMTADRFAAVTKGMSEADVIRALGRPLAKNMVPYPERKISAWYYPKNAAGEAAGVFFNDARVVHSTDFTAVKFAQEGPTAPAGTAAAAPPAQPQSAAQAAGS